MMNPSQLEKVLSAVRRDWQLDELEREALEDALVVLNAQVYGDLAFLPPETNGPLLRYHQAELSIWDLATAGGLAQIRAAFADQIGALNELRKLAIASVDTVETGNFATTALRSLRAFLVGGLVLNLTERTRVALKAATEEYSEAALGITLPASERIRA